ncbi:hypothetical protein BC829DRAFT_401812 [Chytridium lagenaria]|nr:hypothetical protein BC829DRAFT_401812 [Chytridium lagenaria]
MRSSSELLFGSKSLFCGNWRVISCSTIFVVLVVITICWIIALLFRDTNRKVSYGEKTHEDERLKHQLEKAEERAAAGPSGADDDGDGEYAIEPMPEDPQAALAAVLAPRLTEDDLKRGAALKRLTWRAVKSAGEFDPSFRTSLAGSLQSMATGYFAPILASKVVYTVGIVAADLAEGPGSAAQIDQSKIAMWCFTLNTPGQLSRQDDWVATEVFEMLHTAMMCVSLVWASSQDDIEKKLQDLDKLRIVRGAVEGIQNAGGEDIEVDVKGKKPERRPTVNLLEDPGIQYTVESVMVDERKRAYENECALVRVIRKATLETQIKLSTFRNHLHWNPTLLDRIMDEADADVGGVNLGADLNLLNARMLSKDGFCFFLETTRFSTGETVVVKVLCGDNAAWNVKNVSTETAMLREAKVACEHLIGFVGLCTLPSNAPWMQFTSDDDTSTQQIEASTPRKRLKASHASSSDAKFVAIDEEDDEGEGSTKGKTSMVDMAGARALVFKLTPVALLPPWRCRFKMMMDVVAAVVFLHSCNVIHLNLQPTILGLGVAAVRATKSEAAPPPIRYHARYFFATEHTDVYALGRIILDLAGDRNRPDLVPKSIRSIAETCMKEECLVSSSELMRMLMELRPACEEWDNIVDMAGDRPESFMGTPINANAFGLGTPMAVAPLGVNDLGLRSMAAPTPSPFQSVAPMNAGEVDLVIAHGLRSSVPARIKMPEIADLFSKPSGTSSKARAAAPVTSGNSEIQAEEIPDPIIPTVVPNQAAGSSSAVSVPPLAVTTRRSKRRR